LFEVTEGTGESPKEKDDMTDDANIIRELAGGDDEAAGVARSIIDQVKAAKERGFTFEPTGHVTIKQTAAAASEWVRITVDEYLWDEFCRVREATGAKGDQILAEQRSNVGYIGRELAEALAA
jgi:hypothetical protein